MQHQGEEQHRQRRQEGHRWYQQAQPAHQYPQQVPTLTQQQPPSEYQISGETCPQPMQQWFFNHPPPIPAYPLVQQWAPPGIVPQYEASSNQMALGWPVPFQQGP